MARPRAPLVVKRDALETALEMIDTEGVESFTVNRLARALGVTGPSLYHHFGTRADIVEQAARLALAEAWAAPPDEGRWQDWLHTSARHLRTALMRHPALIPVLAGRQPDSITGRALDAWAARLMHEGLPRAGVLPIAEAVVQLAVGSALHSVAMPDDQNGYLASLEAKHRALATVVAERGLSSEEGFDIMVSSVLEGFDKALHSHQDRRTSQPWPRQRPSGRANRSDDDRVEVHTDAPSPADPASRRRRPGRPPSPVAGDDTRERILRAGRQAFNEAGYEATTFKAVARRAGVTRQVVHYHFGGKEALFRAIFDSTRSAVIEAGVKRAAAQPNTVKDQLAASLEAAVHADSRDSSHARFISGSMVDAFRNPELHNAAQGQVDAVREFLTSSLQDAQQAGHISSDADLAGLTEMLVAAMWGMGIYAGYIGRNQSMASAVHEFTRLLATATWQHHPPDSEGSHRSTGPES